MKDPIEQFIQSHRDTLYEVEPSEFSFEDFQSKKIFPKKKTSYFLRYAAASVLVLIGALGFWIHSLQLTQETALHPEVVELEDYYNRLIGNIQQVNLSEEQGAQRAYVLTQLQALEEEYRTLKNDLGEGVSSMSVTEAMIENYQLRIYLLEQWRKDELNSSETSKKDSSQLSL